MAILRFTKSRESLFYEYFILASSDSVPISLSILLLNRRLRVCTPPYLLHPCPFPSLTTSHLLDLIEFFPEEEMFPPNESVEILHSDKHDPIFRLIKESISLPCLRRELSVVVGRSFLSPSPPFFPFREIFRLCLFQKRFSRKRIRYSRMYRALAKSLYLKLRAFAQFLQTGNC